MDGLLYLTTIYHLCICTVQTINDVTDDHVTCITTGQQEVAVEYFKVWDIQNSVYYQYDIPICRSKWPRCLMSGSVAARLLGLRFRIPPVAWMLSVVSVVCCLVEAFETG
jgi:hypothetical protein